MTQEDKSLLLKDLCARLPYKVICKLSMDGAEITEQLKIGGLSNFIHGILNVKPYLRPMSSMTEEEMKKYHSYCECDDGDFTGEILYFDTIESFDYLNSIHVDYRNLIPLGLAIEVTEENNPYENYDNIS